MHFFLSGAPPAPLRLNPASRTVKNTASLTCSALGGDAKTEKQNDLKIEQVEKANLAKQGNIIYYIYNIQMCYKIYNIFAVIRGNGTHATKTPATVITDKYKGHLPHNNHTAVAYIGTLMLRSVNYAKTSG